jgi:meso-butanediol dehydrogenase/(S,S)-butanediol dehydrogenase/diacetyl reductase
MPDEKKVVLITGGGSGLGRDVALNLAESGYLVCATVREAVDLPQRESLTYLTADMNSHGDLPGLIEQVVARHGRLDGLVCNAAVQGFGHVLETSLDAWNQTMSVNLTAPFILAQAAAPHLAKTGGLITFISSVHGVLAAPSRTMYAVSKAGLIAMARNMAADLSPLDVRVVSLVLGPFASPALSEGASRFFPDETPADAITEFGKRQPLGRVGSADELAQLLHFLMSGSATFITGTSIAIDGGQSSRLLVPDLKA